jgi:arginine/lysine/histidine transporter system substrate-binding protein
MLKLKYTTRNILERGENKMAKKLTVALVVIMLIVGFGVGLVSSAFILPKSTTEDTAWTNIQKTGVINVGTDPSWPPYQKLDADGKTIIGFEVDLANAAAAKLGLRINWVNSNFDDIITSVRGGQLDMGVSGFSITSDRLDQVSFTIPHSVSQSQVIMLKSTMDKYQITTITSLQQLKDLGIVVGTQSGEIEEKELQEAGVQNHAWTDSTSSVLDMISANPSVEAVYAETPVTNAWIDLYNTSNIHVVYSHPYYPVAFVVAKGSHTLLDKINGALTDLIADGTVDQLKVQWHAQT